MAGTDWRGSGTDERRARAHGKMDALVGRVREHTERCAAGLREDEFENATVALGDAIKCRDALHGYTGPCGLRACFVCAGYLARANESVHGAIRAIADALDGTG